MPWGKFNTVHFFPDGIFKIPDFLDWKVVINHPKLIAKYWKVPENMFSSQVALEAVHQYFF